MNGKREPVLVDTWLWAARLVKTRAQAVEAMAEGRVNVNGEQVAAGATVGVGDRLELHVGEGRVALVVRGVATLRGPERIAQRLYEEQVEEGEDGADQHGGEPRPTRIAAATAAAGGTKRDRRVSEQSANARRVAPRGGGRGR